jgi:hypothetical protein
MRAKSLVNVTLAFGMILSAGCLDAQERGFAVTAASGPPNAYVQPFGVPLAPPVYFVNFLLLYWSNPEIAAYMPAYRAALPQEVYQCLVENPLGCPYADMAEFFAEQALASGGGSRNKNTVWPVSCQTDPRWQALAPREYRRADQINEPLGTRRAEQLARAFGIDQEMILTGEEYACLIGGPGPLLRPFREQIVLCSIEFTNSKGHAVIPLSSYGLFPDAQGGVRSLCASEGTFEAPCLKANDIFFGPLEAIAAECGFEDKLRRLTTETPMLEFAVQGNDCQQAWAGACIAEAACPGNGGQSNNSCAPFIATPD